METEVRKFQAKDENFSFEVLVVDKPEKWAPASEFSSTYEMKTPGDTGRSLSFLCHGVSMRTYNEMVLRHPLPDEPSYDDVSISGKEALKKAHLLDREKVILNRQVELFEKSLRKEFPGKTIEEKAEFLSKRDKGEIEALFSYISDIVTGARDGQMMSMYELVASYSPVESKPVGSLEDWGVAAETKAFFRLQRPFEAIITEFPLRGISQDELMKIDIETGNPDPPKMPGKNPQTGRRDGKFMTPNFKDFKYLETVKANREKRTVMILDASLTFRIPGETITEKYDWISDRLYGEVVRVQKFIEEEVCDYKGRYDFFTKA